MSTTEQEGTRTIPAVHIAQAPTTFRTFVPPRLADIEPAFFVPRRELPQGVLAGVEADTMGWSTVNAIRLPLVNQTLQSSSLYPDSFSKDLQAGWTVSGAFEPWTLVRGGSGAILFMRTPIKDARMTFLNTPDLVIPQGAVSISIKLQYLPQPPAGGGATPASDNGQPQYLARDAKSRSFDDPAVVIQNVDYGSTTPSLTQDTLFRGAMQAWFQDNLSLFTYVFTVVNLNAKAAQGEFQWLKPTYTSYAYFNGATDETSYFGVLNMTDNASAEGLTNQLPPAAIPAGCNSSLLIANGTFLCNMVLKGLPRAFVNSTESDFRIADNGTLIESVNEIQMEDVTIAASSYTPLIQRFRFQIVGDEMQLDTKVKVNVSPGIDVFVSSTDYYRLKLVNKPDGTQTLDWVESRQSVRDNWFEKATWVVVTEILAGVILAVAGTVGGAYITEGIRRVVAVVVILVIAGVLAAIPSIIAAVVNGKAADVLPSIGSLVADATGDFEWPRSSGFLLKTVELNGSYVLGGDLQYDS